VEDEHFTQFSNFYTSYRILKCPTKRFQGISKGSLQGRSLARIYLVKQDKANRKRKKEHHLPEMQKIKKWQSLVPGIYILSRLGNSSITSRDACDHLVILVNSCFCYYSNMEKMGLG
jgi:hypothetical protein